MSIRIKSKNLDDEQKNDIRQFTVAKKCWRVGWDSPIKFASNYVFWSFTLTNYCDCGSIQHLIQIVISTGISSPNPKSLGPRYNPFVHRPSFIVQLNSNFKPKRSPMTLTLISSNLSAINFSRFFLVVNWKLINWMTIFIHQ